MTTLATLVPTILLLALLFRQRDPLADETLQAAEPSVDVVELSPKSAEPAPERTALAAPTLRPPHALARVEHTLRGRIVDSRGAPVALCEIECDLRAQRGANWLWTARRPTATDADGRFELCTDFGRGVTSVHVEIRAVPWAEVDSAARTLVELGASEVSELGELTLEIIETVVSGVVVNQLGIPLVDATIAARDHWTRGSSLLLARTDAFGRFELRGTVHGRAIMATARHDGYLTSAEREFTVGSSDVHFQLDPAGALRGEVWADAWVPLDEMIVTCRENGLTRGARLREVKSLELDGSFFFDELRPGKYDVTIAARRTRETLFEVAALDVEPYANGWLPELSPIDLRERIRGAEITLSHAHTSQPIEGARLFVEADSVVSELFLGTGSTTILTRAARVDVAARARGFLIASAQDVRARCALELAPAPTLAIALPPGFEWPSDALRLGVQFELEQPFDELPDNEVVRRARNFGAAPSTSLARRTSVSIALQPGRYRGTFVAQRVDSRGRLRRLSSDGTPPTFELEVRPFDAGAACAVAPSAERCSDWRAQIEAARR